MTDATLAQRQADDDAFVQRHLRRNFTGHFIHGMLGLTGFRVMYAPTLIPSYILLLTGSAAMVGLGQSLLQLGAILSPIVGAARIEHRARVLPYAIRVGGLMRVQILGLALAGWFLGGWALVAVTLMLFFLLGIFTGTQRVAFQMLMSKVIPIARRGRLQGYRNLTGGAIAAVMSYWAGAYLIERDVWGNGYATTFFVTFVLTSLGLFALQAMMKEPDAVTVRGQVSLRERMRDLPELLSDPDYRWFIIAQGLAIAGRVGAPFYVLIAAERMGMDGSTIGLLSLAFLGADTLSNLLWGQMGDRLGFRAAFIAAVALWIGGIAMLLLAATPGVIVASFCLLGAAASGYQMSATTMVLEFGAREDTAMRLALSTTVEGTIAAAGPLIGGLVVHLLGARVLMAVALGFLVAALLVLLFRVREPRRRVPAVVFDDLGTPEA
ncbi:MAG: major facilitator superfamily 1 [Sphingomonas bacterium]|uniref:MFS transporter n=1 Tax=Sphingomonas bacterium TaxID=1895847 RepID=UPI002612A8A7|nr:MFS transporter [Sphingomonas bacterium]MDB5694463.1 major facilitator superfamily 1 [Sphingomonas bacterium]